MELPPHQIHYGKTLLLHSHTLVCAMMLPLSLTQNAPLPLSLTQNALLPLSLTPRTKNATPAQNGCNICRMLDTYASRHKVLCWRQVAPELLTKTVPAVFELPDISLLVLYLIICLRERGQGIIVKPNADGIISSTCQKSPHLFSVSGMRVEGWEGETGGRAGI